MKEQDKKADELAETKPLETIPSTKATEGEETQRLRALTVQEIEQILADETSRPARRSIRDAREESASIPMPTPRTELSRLLWRACAD